MTLYQVSYRSFEPITGQLTINANDEYEAEALALEKIEEDLPELEDTIVIDIKEINAR